MLLTDACPVLCSGNGVYEGGVCKCFDSWKGAECSVQAHHCEGCIHGRCVAGECQCEEGWRGERCDEVDCPVSDCSEHGLCHEGMYCSNHYSCLGIRNHFLITLQENSFHRNLYFLISLMANSINLNYVYLSFSESLNDSLYNWNSKSKFANI